ncbi:DUF1127 domain-containing protein [Pseudooceanicola nitratireducens]|jgi:uncharacterized protein YjiS (DUF1127 family)|uniref:Uncharacterized conserved protein YjiS, DUF1127 family n=1 Tax=Pseudooceanicola nitratireducens TaxID=517719 RepID=A0A1I1NJY6_9RHOB|nr:DUF1127 domain-containing protein [Pseudooceanicola nitratireducens]MEC7299363.1 DUF1127 domain-containing protein [Pseudomonadota bacterium]MEC7669088.1 DUF1127 domain-containing protein [Pseudomonadota bacterium]MEC8668868.1 DUF1127 domain-containing protein [Pseudomonadota bacterium]MEC9103617.1 DUF1127 domain-containing protein [Pseudomonadota bacterium]MEC9310426.1 DUF1127 domain-containing protein [Pseudomonadota bacterium]
MSIYTMTPRAQTGLSTPIGRIGRTLSDLHLTLRAWNDRRVTRRLLSNLTDRELNDIGLQRHEIDELS